MAFAISIILIDGIFCEDSPKSFGQMTYKQITQSLKDITNLVIFNGYWNLPNLVCSLK